MFRKLIGACVGLALMGMAGTAHAVAFQLDFTASGFGPGAPEDPVSGTAIYQAASINSPVVALTSIDLTIDGHTYSIGEVGFTNNFFPPVGTSIFGNATPLSDMTLGTDDFELAWISATSQGDVFQYTTSASGGLFFTLTFDAFNITAIPEPSTLALFATGLALLGFIGWRRRRVVQVKAA